MLHLPLRKSRQIARQTIIQESMSVVQFEGVVGILNQVNIGMTLVP